MKRAAILAALLVACGDPAPCPSTPGACETRQETWSVLVRDGEQRGASLARTNAESCGLEPPSLEARTAGRVRCEEDVMLLLRSLGGFFGTWECTVHFVGEEIVWVDL